MLSCLRDAWSGLVLAGTLLLSPAVVAEKPRTAYWLHCAGCHLLDGSSAPPEVPTLIGEPGRIAGLPGGRDYLMRIPGVAQAGLGDEKLADVLNFMLEEFSSATLPADFQPFSGDEVGQARKQVLINPLRSRADILAR